MSISEPMHVPKPVASAQRIEVFTGAGRRRLWSAEEKASIVEESLAEGATVCAVARRNGLTPQQLFTWRREARQRGEAKNAISPPQFAPVIVVAPADGPESARKGPKRPTLSAAPTIELEIGSVTVRIGRDAEAEAIAAVIRALKAGA